MTALRALAMIVAAWSLSSGRRHVSLACVTMAVDGAEKATGAGTLVP